MWFSVLFASVRLGLLAPDRILALSAVVLSSRGFIFMLLMHRWSIRRPPYDSVCIRMHQCTSISSFTQSKSHVRLALWKKKYKVPKVYKTESAAFCGGKPLRMQPLIANRPQSSKNNEQTKNNWLSHACLAILVWLGIFIIIAISNAIDIEEKRPPPFDHYCGALSCFARLDPHVKFDAG